MKISLAQTRVESLSLVAAEDVSEQRFDLSFGDGYSDDDVQSFVIRFTLMLISPQGYELNVVFLAFFSTDEDVSEEFKASHFVRINAPAIAYPFLRSFVSTVTVNSGYDSVILPALNFQAMATERDEEA